MDYRTKVQIKEVGGLKCQGKKEILYIESLIENNLQLPSKPLKISTPYGDYSPDFEFEDKYVEIKSTGTLKVLMGEKEYIKGSGLSLKQKEKIEWVHNNIKPVEIIVYKNDKVVQKNNIFNLLIS